MNKTLIRGLIIGGITVVVYQGIRIFMMAKAAIAMATPLKEYLSTKFGEEVNLRCSVEINIGTVVSIVAKLSQATLDQHPEIEETIWNYIAENYPVPYIKRLKVRTYDKDKSSIDILKEEQPTFYKLFGKTIEKKLLTRNHHVDILST